MYEYVILINADYRSCPAIVFECSDAFRFLATASVFWCLMILLMADP